MKGASGPLFHSGPVLLVAVLIVLVLQLLYAVHNRATLETRGYLGPDSYMRMLRVEKLMQTGDWFDRVSDRTNAPYGELLPWGRPLDGILVAVAAAISPFTEQKTAVYWAGLALGPLLALAMIPIWSWGTRPFLGGGVFLMIFVLMPLCVVLSFNLKAARADHHGFLALLFIIQLCAAFRIAAGQAGKRTALLIGIVGGVMVWASIMELLAQIVITLVFVLRFLRFGTSAAREIFHYTAGLALAFSVALPLERGTADLLAADVNKLSIAHWTLATAAAATWWGIDRHLRRRPVEASRRVRWLMLLLGGGLPVGVAGLLFPDVLRGPTAPYAAEVVAFYFNNITEFQPLFPTSMRTLAKFFQHLGPALVALGFIAWDYRKAAAARRALYDIVLVGLAVYVPMTLWVARFAIYVDVLILVPWAMALAGIMTWTRTVAVGGRRIPVRGVAVVAAVVAPVVAAAMVLSTLPQSPKYATPSEWAAMADYLTGYARETAPASRKPGILLSYIGKGPELAWRTPYRVVGAPYANVDSLRDTDAILRAGTDAGARRAIDRRGIELFLYCVEEPENRRYRDGASRSFLSRIENNIVPDWLVPVPLPDRLSRQFRLYRIAGR